jgi:hypothetical protein
VTGGWRKLHNEELHDLYSPPSIIRIIKSWGNEVGGACSADGEEEEGVHVIGSKARRNPGCITLR